MSPPQAVFADSDAKPATEEEVDLWWGSYAGRDMTPSFAVCVVITVIINWLAHLLVRERGWVQLAFTVVAGGVWVIQLIRWAKRYFGWNHRLTTRAVYIDRGWTRLKARRIPLKDIGIVTIRRKGLARFLGIGDIVLWLEATGQKPAVLRAVTSPLTVAEIIREAVKNAKESETQQAADSNSR